MGGTDGVGGPISPLSGVSLRCGADDILVDDAGIARTGVDKEVDVLARTGVDAVGGVIARAGDCARTKGDARTVGEGAIIRKARTEDGDA